MVELGRQPGVRLHWDDLRGATVEDVHLDWRSGRTVIDATCADGSAVSIVVMGTRSLRCPRSSRGRIVAAWPTSTEDAAYLRLELSGAEQLEVVGSGTFLRVR
ncbi:MAG: hypothetical protein H6738_20005 [Alphaproteobacteria bacterium]|nr:hypothetical protein [Alphaproteobacteria bacterium]MCB9699076.1 hypothetical protein [Alphaproteobacteria bacterium]